MDFLGIKTFRLWGAYTQQSYWQAFSIGNSAPFRETVYEPELIGTFGTGYRSGLKFINLGFVHQSNGRSLPDSRSWERVYALGGWEWNDTTSIMLRAWKRLPENPCDRRQPRYHRLHGARRSGDPLGARRQIAIRRDAAAQQSEQYQKPWL